MLGTLPALLDDRDEENAQSHAAYIWRARPESFAEMSKIYALGREVVWAAITSCRKYLDYAAYMAYWDQGCVLEIRVAEDIYDISEFSFFPMEQEVLLPPNAKLVVTGTRTEMREAANKQNFDLKIIVMQQITSAQALIS